MEGLTRLRTSCRVYRSHVTRIRTKVEETLTEDIDELALTCCYSTGEETRTNRRTRPANHGTHSGSGRTGNSYPRCRGITRPDFGENQ